MLIGGKLKEGFYDSYTYKTHITTRKHSLVKNTNRRMDCNKLYVYLRGKYVRIVSSLYR